MIENHGCLMPYGIQSNGKNKLYYKFRKINSVYNEISYKSYKQVLQRTLLAAEKQYYHKLLIMNKDNMKKSWGVIKNIINRIKILYIRQNLC